MLTVRLPADTPYARVGPYLPGVEYQVDDLEAQRLIDVKGFELVDDEEEEG